MRAFTHHMVCMDTGLKILESSAEVTLKPLRTEETRTEQTWSDNMEDILGKLVMGPVRTVAMKNWHSRRREKDKQSGVTQQLSCAHVKAD